MVGYVQFKYSDDSKTAINVLNKGEIDGNVITVEKSKREEDRKRKYKYTLKSLNFVYL